MRTLFALILTAVMSPAFAKDHIASCSVGTTMTPHWYGDVIMPQRLKINTESYSVEQVEEGPLGDDSKNLTVQVNLNWMNPRYVPKDIFIAGDTFASIGREAVTWIDIEKNLQIYCQIKN